MYKCTYVRACVYVLLHYIMMGYMRSHRAVLYSSSFYDMIYGIIPLYLKSHYYMFIFTIYKSYEVTIMF